MKIFLVEDAPLLAERLAGLLGAIPGARIVGRAAGALQAVDGILATRPDVVVLDVRLAQGSGFDVLRLVHPQAPAIDFYVLSNFASEAYHRRAARIGARGFFDKTNEFERMRDVIAQRAAA